MDQLRLIHVGGGAVIAAALTIAGCRASEAGPTSGLAAPAGWRAMPELATAATDAAKQTKITVEGAEAWGEPARGCYAAWLSLRGATGQPDVLAEQMLASVTSEPALAGITLRDVVKPAPMAPHGELAFGFSRGGYTGKVRAPIAKTGDYALLACFWNMREPSTCEAACNAFVGSMK